MCLARYQTLSKSPTHTFERQSLRPRGYARLTLGASTQAPLSHFDVCSTATRIRHPVPLYLFGGAPCPPMGDNSMTAAVGKTDEDPRDCSTSSEPDNYPHEDEHEQTYTQDNPPPQKRKGGRKPVSMNPALPQAAQFQLAIPYTPSSPLYPPAFLLCCAVLCLHVQMSRRCPMPPHPPSPVTPMQCRGMR